MSIENKPKLLNEDSKDRKKVLLENVAQYTKVYYNTEEYKPVEKRNIAIQTSTLDMRFTIYLNNEQLNRPDLEEHIERVRHCLYNFCCYVRRCHDFVLHLPTALDIEQKEGELYICYTKPQLRNNVRILAPYSRREDFLGMICDEFSIKVQKAALRIIRRKFREHLGRIIRERELVELYDTAIHPRKNYTINDEDIEWILENMGD